MKTIKNIIREVEPSSVDFSICFEDDRSTEAGGDYNYSLFIVSQSRNQSGFNENKYADLQREIEDLFNTYFYIKSKSAYAQYSSVGAMLVDYKLIDSIHNTKRIKEFVNFLDECYEKPKSPYANYYDNFSAHKEEMTAKYLTLKTGTEWDVDSATGYCQGDYVKVVYCKEHYKDGAKFYGEVWLGAAKEFCVIEIGEDGEEGMSCYGYIVADCQAYKDEDYKKIVCEWACIKEDETRLEMIDESHTYTKYIYRSA